MPAEKTEKTTPSTSGPGTFNLSDPSTMNMLAWMLGGGAQAIMGEHQQTWQAGLGRVAQEAASAKQFGELLKKLLAGGGKISADQGGTTLKMPSGETTTQGGQPQQQQQQPQGSPGLLGFLLANQ